MTKIINLRKKQRKNYKPINKHINAPKIKFEKIEISKILICIISIIAIILGCIIYKRYNNNIATEFCSDFILKLKSESFFDIFSYLIKLDLLFLVITFFIGTSLIGAPLTIFPVIIKSFFIGYFNSFIYCEYELKGILFSLIFIFPLFTILTTSLIYSVNESFYMSKYVFYRLSNKNTADIITIKLYLLRYLFLFVISFISILIDSLLITLLSNRFSLI